MPKWMHERFLVSLLLGVFLAVGVTVGVTAGEPAPAEFRGGNVDVPVGQDSMSSPPHPKPAPAPIERAEVRPAALQDVYVAETYNYLYGTVGARAAIAMHLLDGLGGEKGRNIVEADGKGFFEAGFYPNGIRQAGDTAVDVAEGDQILVETGGATLRGTVPAMATTVDVATDRVIGHALPYTEVTVRLKGQVLALTTNFAGAYSVSFAGRVDILPADEARVLFRAGDFWMEKNAFAPGALVRPHADEVIGYSIPGSDVSAALYSSQGILKGTARATTTLTEGAYSFIFGDKAPVDIVPGDTVVVTTTEKLSVPVLDLQAEVDIAGNRVHGIAPAGRRVRVAVAHNGLQHVEWFVRHATADAAGHFSIGFGDVVDLLANDDVWVTVGDAAGATEIYARAEQVLVDHYYDKVEGVALPGEMMTVSLYDAQGVLLERVITQASTPRGEFTAGFATDIRAGQRIEVRGIHISRTVDVVGFGARVDIDAEVLEIMGPASARLYGWYSTQNGEVIYITAVTDAQGRARVDLSDYDLLDGDDGSLYYEDTDGDINYFKFRQPSLAANARQGRIMAWFDRSSPAQFQLFSSAGALKASASLNANPAGFVEWWPAVPLQVGDRVSIECCDGRQAELTLSALQADADVSANTINGMGMPNAVIVAEVNQVDPVSGENVHYEKAGLADPTGHFSVGFDGMVDIQAGDRFMVWWQNSDGDWMVVDRYTPMFSVNLTERAVYGVGLEYASPVTITVRDPQGGIRTHLVTQSDRWGAVGWTVLPEPFYFGDVAYIVDGAGEILIPVAELRVDIDPEADRVTLAGLAEAPVDLWVEHPPELGDWAKYRGATDAAGVWAKELAGEVDLRAGDRVLAYHTNPDGHRVGVLLSALRLAAHETYANVEVWTEPGSTVTLTVRAADGRVREEKVVRAHPTSGRVYRGEGQFESFLVPGDILEADNGRVRVQVPLKRIWARMDMDANQVVGTAPAGRPIRVDFAFAAGGYATAFTASDAEGRFAVSPPDGAALAAGDRADVWYIDEDGQRVGILGFKTQDIFMPLAYR